MPNTAPTPPSSPMMSVPYTAEEALMSSIPGVPDAPDDVEDPPVPPGTTDIVPPTVPALPESLVPLAHGFCQYVQGLLGKQLDDAGVKMARSVDTTITSMADYTKGVLATSEHAHYSFADALAKITQTQAPYRATLAVVSRAGVPLTLTIAKPTAGELVEELGKLMPWLEANGYTGQSHATY